MGEAKRRQAHIEAGGEDWGLVRVRSAGSPRRQRRLAVGLVRAFMVLRATLMWWQTEPKKDAA